LIEPHARGRAEMVARQAGIACGLQACRVILDEMEIDAEWVPHVRDGEPLAAGGKLATIAGAARDLLTAERLLLNFVGRLAGIATWTNRYVRQLTGTRTRIYDTRKTTPGWRRLEKFAVRCGGGCNHRTGLFDAVLIKDNHLAHVAGTEERSMTPAEAVAYVRTRLAALLPNESDAMILEVEVDSLEQLRSVLPQHPDIVLLDNMTLDQLQAAVRLRNETAPDTELEASGGVTLECVSAIARTGVERISIGALTHSATSIDIGMDWRRPA
jgi:nicotinate-nucleotide pyrophosphorylase (carboxylating)